VWNFSPASAAELSHKIDVFDQHCQTLGRDPSQIRKTVAVRINPLLDMDGFRSTMEQYAQLGVDLIDVTPGREQRPGRIRQTTR
jgi:hypothetical protein